MIIRGGGHFQPLNPGLRRGRRRLQDKRSGHMTAAVLMVNEQMCLHSPTEEWEGPKQQSAGKRAGIQNG